MELIADLHVHSRFSRATSRQLDFVSLGRVALQKGIGLLGTGDFTHPGWMAEIEAQLEPAEDGLFRLRPELAAAARQGLPTSCDGEVRFVLQVEISNIYKQDGKTRKNHNLVFCPSLHAAKALIARLEAIGNLRSDGRPILGLSARNLLETVLETDERAFLVPAHIWTPWFSMLGSKSGFDTLEECFGDLCGHVFACETGLSSDPPMNWRVSGLDKVRLISNSDAHSAGKLAREANLLDIDPSYENLLRALRDGEGFLGTLEFFPEEGKYHLDGHRKCELRLDPEQTAAYGGKCPLCGGELTVGVMSRVHELSDRPFGEKPPLALPFESLVPLEEAAAEVVGSSGVSKKATELVEKTLRALGPELYVLRRAPLEDIRAAGGAPLAEAIRRIRGKELSIDPGYDGEFGKVRIFGSAEREKAAGQLTFLPPRRSPRPRRSPDGPLSAKKPTQSRENRSLTASPEPNSTDPLEGLDADQRHAAQCLRGPLLVVAGPGAGKTRTLVARMAYQVHSGYARPNQILAIAFTRQAAAELEQRVLLGVPGAQPGSPLVRTFHGYCLDLIRELRGEAKIASEEERLALAKRVLSEQNRKGGGEKFLALVSLAKQSLEPSQSLKTEADTKAFMAYQTALREQGLMDLDDIVLESVRLLESEPSLGRCVSSRFRAVCVDEYQDVNDVQARLVQLLAPGGATLCAIGDPDQAIYGFRGSRPEHFQGFTQVFPEAKVVVIGTSYRLSEPVLEVARSVLSKPRELLAQRSGAPVEIIDCPTAASEAEQVVVRVEQLLGGTSHFSLTSGRAIRAELANIGLGDIAVLTRTKAQHDLLSAALDRGGLPHRLVAEDEPHDPRCEKIALMTMHASKGREFEVVFVCGVEKGLVPLERPGIETEMDEERRLLYVALSRGKRQVIVTFSRQRAFRGESRSSGPSPLLDGAPKIHVSHKEAVLPKRAVPDGQLSLF
jgi:DNA helicase-2/ATP-dependent DNA helicase PcrA